MTYGVLCRVLLWSSLAHSSPANLTLEMSTPSSVAPDGVLLCLSDALWVQNRSSTAVAGLRASGLASWEQQSQEPELLPPEGDWRSAALFRRALGSPGSDLRPLETVTADAVLCSDPGLAAMCAKHNGHAPTLLLDEAGEPLPAHFFSGAGAAADGERIPGGATAAAATAAEGATATAAATGRLQTSPSGSCVLLSGNWERATRYTVTVTLGAPPSPAKAGEGPPQHPPNMWLAPLTYQHVRNASGAVIGTRARVRGSRGGRWCTLRQGPGASAARMFDACVEAGRRGIVAAGVTNVEACLAALRAALSASPVALAGAHPFNQPPLAPSAAPVLGDGPATPPRPCPHGHVWSRGAGGECIDCGSGRVQAGRCVCTPGRARALLGRVACGEPLAPGLNASDATQLAAQLCATYSQIHRRMLQGDIADRLVHSLYPAAIVRQAAPLLDAAALEDAGAAFSAEQAWDERAPASPSRRHGVGPRCSGCNAAGRLSDIYTGALVPVPDDRFRAVQALRFLGYALATAGHACPALWDAAAPRAKMYGPRGGAAVCAPLPA